VRLVAAGTFTCRGRCMQIDLRQSFTHRFVATSTSREGCALPCGA
jgi:hypothetical protein